MGMTVKCTESHSDLAPGHFAGLLSSSLCPHPGYTKLLVHPPAQSSRPLSFLLVYSQPPLLFLAAWLTASLLQDSDQGYFFEKTLTKLCQKLSGSLRGAPTAPIETSVAIPTALY